MCVYISQLQPSAQGAQQALTRQRLEPQVAFHARLGQFPPPLHPAAARRAQRASIRRAQGAQQALTRQRLEPQVAFHARLGRFPPPLHPAAARCAQRASIRLLRGRVRAQGAQQALTRQRLERPQVAFHPVLPFLLQILLGLFSGSGFWQGLWHVIVVWNAKNTSWHLQTTLKYL
jgi:hypothetical protein